MSRKSKRRRIQDPQQPALGGGAAAPDSFEFLDDRSDTAPKQRAVTRGPAAAESHRLESVPARGTVGVATEEPPLPGRGTRAAADARGAAAAPPPPAAPPAEPVVTLGEVLTTAREARGLSIEEASARTRISVKMLAHLESDRFSEFAAEAYARGFLRGYGTFLGLDPQMLLERYETLQGRAPEPESEVWEPVVEPAQPRPRGPRLGRRTAIAAALVLGVAILGGAAFYLTERGFVALRPSAGLAQIEDELRRAQDASGTAVVQSAPPETTPETTPGSATTAPEDRSPPLPPLPGATAGLAGGPAPVAEPHSGPDLVQETEPAAPPAAAPPVPVAAVQPAPLPAGDATLTLAVTALDSCVVRVQVDTDARNAQRYTFSQRGETRTWSAKQSFRVLAQPTQHIELRLNNRLVSLPPDGRTIVLDRATLDPARHGTATRSSGSGARRARSTTRTTKPAPAPAPPPPVRPSTLEPQHAAGPP